MPIQGTPKFNAITLMRIEAIDFTQGSPQLAAHGAFISTESGDTFGRTTCRHFSKSTLEKLMELRAAMEEDLAALVFEGTGDTPAYQAVVEEDVRGLREEHGDADTESV